MHKLSYLATHHGEGAAIRTTRLGIDWLNSDNASKNKIKIVGFVHLTHGRGESTSKTQQKRLKGLPYAYSSNFQTLS